MTPFEERYAPPSHAEVAQLIAEHPLAWVLALGAQSVSATPLPLMARLDEEGRVAALGGHYARANPHVKVLRGDPRALILFLGPHGYVSPSWMTDRTQAPTWNYASVQFLAEIVLAEEPTQIGELVEVNERGRPRAWSSAEMGSRYGRLARGVVGFEAKVVATHARFKLGQDERDDVYPEILEGLKADGRDDLVEWMQRSNPGR